MNYNNDEFVQKVCEQVRFKSAHKTIKQELNAHIDENIENYISQGIDEKTATIKAIKCMGNPIEIGKNLNKIHKPQMEWTVICSIILLSIFGISAMFFIGDLSFGNGRLLAQRQIVYMLIGLVLLVSIYLFDYTKIYKYRNLIYAFGIVLTIITVLFGVSQNKLLYLRIGSISFRTASTCNLMFMLSIIAKISKYKNKGIRDFLKIGVLCLISLSTLVFNPDSNLIYVMLILYTIILTVSVFKKQFDYKQKWLYLGVIYGVFFVSLFCVSSYMKEYNNQTMNYSFNVANTYLKSSQWLGKSTYLIESGYISLPENWADYFLIVIIANLGWIFGIAIISLFVVLFMRMIFKSLKVKYNFGFYIAMTTSTYLIINCIMHILSNIGVCKGFSFSLPFVAFGGSDYINNILFAGLFLSVWRRNLIISSDMNVS